MFPYLAVAETKMYVLERRSALSIANPTSPAPRPSPAGAREVFAGRPTAIRGHPGTSGDARKLLELHTSATTLPREDQMRCQAIDPRELTIRTRELAIRVRGEAIRTCTQSCCRRRRSGCNSASLCLDRRTVRSSSSRSFLVELIEHEPDAVSPLFNAVTPSCCDCRSLTLWCSDSPSMQPSMDVEMPRPHSR